MLLMPLLLHAWGMGSGLMYMGDVVWTLCVGEVVACSNTISHIVRVWVSVPCCPLG
jgi:hypothetical protein